MVVQFDRYFYVWFGWVNQGVTGIGDLEQQMKSGTGSGFLGLF